MSLVNASIDSKSVKIVQLKDRGGLIYPSSSAIKICFEAEKIIRFVIKENEITPNSKYFVHHITQIILSNFNMIKAFQELLTHSNNSKNY